MNFKKLSVLFCSLLALTSVMAVSAAEAETVSETEAASEEESTASGADEETEYPITIQHAYGETVIESKPERIATVGWENQDTPLALGIAPVGVSAANYGTICIPGQTRPSRNWVLTLPMFLMMWTVWILKPSATVILM